MYIFFIAIANDYEITQAKKDQVRTPKIPKRLFFWQNETVEIA